MNKGSFAIVGIILLSSIVLFNLNNTTDHTFSQKIAFQQWKVEFGKSYQTQQQENYRFNILSQTLKTYNQHNAQYQKGLFTYNLQLNQFSDLTTQQFTKTYLSQNIPNDDFACKGPQYPKKTTFNQTFTTPNQMLTPVITQGDKCTSGYAIATAAAVQASMYKTIKQIYPLSAQQLIDCSKQTGNNGCTSGTPLSALHYLMNRGSMKASDYPYSQTFGDCKYTAAKKVWQVENCTKVDSDLNNLKSQIQQQPVIVGFEVDSKFVGLGTASLYIPDKCTNKINHYMLAVGWGQQQSGFPKKTHFYIRVKNSFGVQWGDKGYANVVMEIADKPTTGCGMLSYMFFPYG